MTTWSIPATRQGVIEGGIAVPQALLNQFVTGPMSAETINTVSMAFKER